MITEERLDELQAMCDEATPPGERWTREWDERPYHTEGQPRAVFAMGPRHGVPKSKYANEEVYNTAWNLVHADRRLINEAPAAMPELIAEVRRLRAEIALRDEWKIWFGVGRGNPLTEDEIDQLGAEFYRKMTDCLARQDFLKIEDIFASCDPFLIAQPLACAALMATSQFEHLVPSRSRIAAAFPLTAKHIRGPGKVTVRADR